MKAIIPAAGLGTRFLPTTKAVPKEMLPVLDRPVIHHVAEEALAAPECDECIIINSHEKTLINEFFSSSDTLVEHLENRGKKSLAQAVKAAGELPVSYVYQDAPKGLGHAVLCGAQATGDEAFYVLLGDVVVPKHSILPKLKEVSDAHGGANVIALIAVPDSEVERFGIVGGEHIGYVSSSAQDGAEAPGAVWKIDQMIEKPALAQAPSRLASFGRYLLTPHVMELLATQEVGHGGEIQLTDALARSLSDEEMYGVVIDPMEGHDTGTIPNFVAANVRMGLADPRYADAIREALRDILH